MSFGAAYFLGVEDGARVRGGPDWVRSTLYTIEAVAAGAADAQTMRGPMLRALLEREARRDSNDAVAGERLERRTVERRRGRCNSS